MRSFIIISLVFLLTSCKARLEEAQNLTCPDTVTLQYDYRNRTGSIPVNKKLKSFTVYFIGSYNDDIEVFVNGKLYYHKHLNIDDNHDNLNDFFDYNYSEDTELPILKIKSKTKETCFDIHIKEKYKILYVFLSERGEWIVRFSNLHYLN
ncbi:MAG: hypothetical protein BM557_07910 [Flavobacterium sp. MedPE-SWcel]|uniref:hypothetical protein n=1 Tax=uncultured Flavobacterium sp. TaxID=165435 RepID=UPI000912E647|nr:hypothetical protein [uncultured Flavobacterium sp.]OIQ18128.1 MAG: hypothetical protein BM557_07910 [Flavobacterium sp. MedPE-SWcel]